MVNSCQPFLLEESAQFILKQHTMFGLILQGNEHTQLFMSTPPSNQASFKHREGVGCLVCFSIQKEKPVKREGTTKEHSRGKFA